MLQDSDFTPIQVAVNKIIEALKPLSDNQRRTVLQSVANLFGESYAAIPTNLTSNQSPTDTETHAPNLQKFIFSKKTKNDAVAVTVLAYYLKKYRNQERFKTSDLEALNKEANTGKVFGNITKTVNNAYSRYRLLDTDGEGYKKITYPGELVVEALPDEEKVKALIEEHKPRAKRKPTKKL